MYKLLIAIFMSFSSIVFSQNNDYVITLQGDTVECTIGKNQHSRQKLKVRIDGEKVKYTPEEILGYCSGSNTYSSGRIPVVVNGSTWHFLKVVTEGELSLYEAYDYGSDGGTPYRVIKFYVKLSSMSNREFIYLSGDIYWKIKMTYLAPNCSSFINKVEGFTEVTIRNEALVIEMVKAYNDKCSK